MGDTAQECGRVILVHLAQMVLEWCCGAGLVANAPRVCAWGNKGPGEGGEHHVNESIPVRVSSKLSQHLGLPIVHLPIIQ